MNAYSEIVKYANETCRFSGNINTIVEQCQGLSAADDLYFEKVQEGGFCALEYALRFYTQTSNPEFHDVVSWNSQTGWKSLFSSIVQDNFWSFAEDVFGNQYIFWKSKVCMFEIETGCMTELCDSFSQWLELIVSSPNYYTGYSIAQQWNQENHSEPLTAQYNLSAIIPFVCGGEYSVSNVFRVDSVKNIELKADFARQIYNLPDGAQINFRFTP